MSLTPGTRLGPYEIQSLLGAGGMGEVYRSRDTKLHRDVAVKVLAPALAQDAAALARFEREAQAVAALSHPNILAIHDFGAAEGERGRQVAYAVTELLEGESLRDRLSGGALAPRKAIEIAVQIARGLAAAHDKGIVHRDLKPENVFLTRDGRVKILDFGLAKLAEAPAASPAGATMTEGTPPATTPGTVLGTVGYMSPEQVRGLPLDSRSDIFSFGAVLYELLTGRRAFGGPTPADTISAILNHDPPEIADADGRIPSALDQLIRHCLEKAPEQRFQSARDIEFALQAIAGGSGSSGARVASGPRRVSARRVAQAAALVALGALAAVAVMSMRPAAPAAVMRVSILPPEGTTIGGTLALSPDGRMLALTAAGIDGLSSLYVRVVDSFEAKPLAGTSGALDPFWSADSRSVAFFAGRKLKRIDASGGPTQTIADVSDSRGGTWNADGVIVFAPNPGDGLYRVAASGGAVTPLTRLDAARQEVSHRWPHFLPDGKHVAFLNRSAARGDRLMLAVASLDGSVPIRLVPVSAGGVHFDGSLLFLRERALLAQPFDPDTLTLSGTPTTVADNLWYDTSTDGLSAFSAARNVVAFRRAAAADSRFMWMTADGRDLGPIGPPGAQTPRFSPDGRRLLIGTLEPAETSVGLWLMDVARGTRSRLSVPPRNDTWAVWSPDGKRVAYASDRAGSFDIYVKQVGAADDTPLLQSRAWKFPEDWSPDGRWLLYYHVHPQTQRDLFALPLDGDRTPVRVAQTDADEWRARFSPDGRWVAYASNETGRDEVYVQAFPAAGERWQISTNGGTEPNWRADGRAVYYLSSDNRLWSVPVGVRADVIEPGTPSALFQARISRSPFEASYAVAPQGDRFIVNTIAEGARATAVDLLIGWQPPR